MTGNTAQTIQASSQLMYIIKTREEMILSRAHTIETIPQVINSDIFVASDVMRDMIFPVGILLKKEKERC